MALLDESQQEEVASFLKGRFGEEEAAELAAAAEEVTTEPDVALEAEESSPSMTEEVSEVEQEVQSDEEVDEEGHAVPYSRFKSIIDSRNEFRNGLDEAQGRIQELEEYLANVAQQSAEPAPPAKTEDDWFESLYSEELEVADPYAEKYGAIENRLNELEVYKAQYQLEEEIGYAEQQYPGVPRSVMLQAVVSNPEVDVMDIAERYSTFISAVQEEAIAQYSQQQQLEAPPPPEAPPRVSNSPSGHTHNGSGHENPPKNLDDAKAQMFDFLKNNWK